MDDYISQKLVLEIYNYFNWYDLKVMEIVSDELWQKICGTFCQDEQFAYKFSDFWRNGLEIKYRDKFLFFISHQIRIIRSPSIYDPLIMRSWDDIPYVLWQDKAFVYMASKYSGYVLKCAPISFQEDRNFVLQQIRKEPNIFQSLVDKHKQDPEIVAEAIKNVWCSIRHVLLFDNPEFMLQAVQIDGNLLQFGNDGVRGNRDIVYAAVKQNVNAFQYATDILRTDKEFVIKLAEITRPSTILRFVSHSSSTSYFEQQIQDITALLNIPLLD